MVFNKNFRCKGTGLNNYINPGNEHLCNNDALDLLTKMLTYDHVNIYKIEIFLNDFRH